MEPAMLAQTLDPNRMSQILDDPRWVLEQKLDGKRLLVEVTDRVAVAYNRNGDPTGLPDKIKDAFDHPGFMGRWVFDGELVGNTYHIFDVLAVKGFGDEWLRTTLEVRTTLLARIFKDRHALPDDGPLRQCKQWWFEEKAAAVEELRDNNAEGFMVKSLDAPYRHGKRSYDFLKFKFVETADVVVVETKVDGKRQAIRIGLYLDGVMVDAGGCKVPEKMVDVVQVGDVLECKYLYGTVDHKLYQPVWVRLRDDKRPEDCTVSQLKYTNREVI